MAFGNDNIDSTTSDEPIWERRVLEDLAFSAVKEQRAGRRWKNVFRGLILLYLVAFLALTFFKSTGGSITTEHTAMINIAGVISSESEANADDIVASLRDAFETETAKGLILRFNTPGGSPVQSGIINDEITRLKATRDDFPVYAVIEDVCASGGYYIAVAADEIYADKASIVGSIGVRMDSFGFTEAIQKLGVERRSITAGEHKSILDPFLPLQQSDVDHAETMLNTVHQQFIDVVEAGRGDRLSNNPDLFSGLFWSGEQALPLGLIDGLANIDHVAREMVGAEEIVDYTYQVTVLERFAGGLGASISQAFIAILNSVQIK